METKEKKKAPEAARGARREAPGRKRPAARPEPARKRPAVKTQQKPPAKRRKPPVAKGKDRDKREAAARAAKLKAMKQSVDAKNAPKAQDRRKVRKPRRPMQPIVYTQPRVFNRNKLLLQLGTILAVVIAMILGLSIFFRVKNIEVSGAEIYSPWAIREVAHYF